jgi:hypothetical protein
MSDIYERPVEPPIPKRLLVIGSPRSGTHFMTALLNIFGMRVRHERMGEDGTVNSAWLAMKKINDSLINPVGRQHYEFDQIIHLVRNPLDTIGSLASEMSQAFWEWQEEHSNIAIYAENPKIDRIAAFWVFWTDGCQHLCDSTIKLESIQHLGPVQGKAVHKRAEVKIADLGDQGKMVMDRMELYGYNN